MYYIHILISYFQLILQQSKTSSLQKDQIMAFVFRSPRNLDSYNLQPNYIEQQKQPTQEQKSPLIKLKRPIKGFTFQVHQRVTPQQNYELSNEQSATKIHQRQQQSKIKIKNNQQYFFKSRSNRFEDQNTTNESQIKQFVKAEIICSGSKKKSRNNILNVLNQRKTVIEQSRQKNSVINNSSDFKNKDIIKKLQQKQTGLPCLMSRQCKNSGSLVNLLHSKKKAQKVFATPSIPGKEQKFGYVLQNNKLSYPKFTTKPRFMGQKDDSPGPTDYNIQLNKKAKGVLKFERHSKNHSKICQNDFYALVDDQEALKKHNQKIKEWVKQGKQKNKDRKKYVLKARSREDMQTRDLSDDSNQSGLTVYEDDNTPGPGYYNFLSPKDKKDFRSKNEKFTKIFINRSQRFQSIQKRKPSSLSFSLQNNIVQKDGEGKANLKKNKFFISKLKRDIKFYVQSQAPCPGHYNVRISMQNDVIQKILRNSPNLFNNKLPRLADPVHSISPGPTYYNLKQPNFKVQSFRPQFKRIQQPNGNKKTSELKDEQKILIQNIKQEIVNKKRDNIIEQKSVPFLSSSTKGLIYKNLSVTDFHTCMPIQPSRKGNNKQNLFPFNSSQQKSKLIYPLYNAEVGLYQLSNNNQMERKSFNILFN